MKKYALLTIMASILEGMFPSKGNEHVVISSTDTAILDAVRNLAEKRDWKLLAVGL